MTMEGSVATAYFGERPAKRSRSEQRGNAAKGRETTTLLHSPGTQSQDTPAHTKHLLGVWYLDFEFRVCSHRRCR